MCGFGGTGIRCTYGMNWFRFDSNDRGGGGVFVFGMGLCYFCGFLVMKNVDGVWVGGRGVLMEWTDGWMNKWIG